jgi:hypothetical protein
VAGFESVNTFIVPRMIIQQTQTVLRRVGQAGYEGLVLWLGRVADDQGQITEAYVPKQHVIRTPQGLGIHVDGDALYELSVYLFENDLQVLIQVHSHGERAYHSDTDDHGSIATTVGSLSVVVPHFATGQFEPTEIAVFKLTSEGWLELSQRQISAALHFAT